MTESSQRESRASRQARTLVDTNAIMPLVERIKHALQPRQIWLFGSRARRTASANSDWDVLVVVDDTAPDSVLEPMVAWTLRRGCGVFADVIVMRHNDFNDDIETRNTLPYVVGLEGLLLYER